jgi:hypothetical protein
MVHRFNIYLPGVLVLLIASPVNAVEEKLTFNKDIRPILSDKCFHCHGFDPKNRKADLRLDDRGAAIEAGAILPGKGSESLIVERMLSHDEDEVMPPPKSKLGRLSEQDVSVIKRWIDQGAAYEAHWAFIPIKTQDLKTQDTGLEMERIVREGLKGRGLDLQPIAAAETLARRLSFDITGLPPEPQTVEQVRTGALKLEAYVDQLLASPRYGERMAVDWLDMARYADSYGFQVDRDREVWRWRDWVIQAFNENLPFDQFVTWQLAGDLLPNPTREQRLATAFSRLHQQESEGGSVEEEYRVEYVADRVQTFSTAFLGLTFECSRCHDHKYDPISQKDYYGLFAMFQNIDEAGLYSFFTQSAPTPALSLVDEATLADLKSKVAALEAKQTAQSRKKLSNKPKPIASFSFDDPASAKLIKGENKLDAGQSGKGVWFSGDEAVTTAVGNFQRHEPFSVSLWMKTPDRKERAVVMHRSRAWTDAASRGYELLIEEGRLKWSLIHFWPGDAISVRTKKEIPLNSWLHVTVTNDGSSRANGLRIYINDELADVEVIRDNLTRNITGGGGDNIALGERFRDRGFKGGQIDEVQVFNTDISLDVPKELTEARAAVTSLMEAAPEIMTMQELPEPKSAYILFRGEYDKRTDPVNAQTPEVLGLLPDDVPKNRLSLARWLTDKKHPLFARVTVNRLWQSLFGRGLVKTVEDFGSQGERPLYPELLDYLAARLMTNGWNMKALIKEIVMSRVYLQRSTSPDARVMTDDPENEWLARGPRFRLSAEMIRDNALVAAGLIKHQIGGVPVQSYEMSEAFKPVKPTDSYRRSVYSHWRRTSPPPAMQTFDAPKRSVCVAKRDRTDTPLQALVLMNGVQYVEAARVLGALAWTKAKGSVDGVVEVMFERCLSRKPDVREMEVCRRLFGEQQKHYQVDLKGAEALLKHGNHPRVKDIPPAQAAAATILAQALLCHDECVVKR